MIWALLGVLLFAGGAGGGFGEKMFGKDNQKLVREVVSDPVREDAAVLVLKQGDKDLKVIAKELGKIAKAFRKADEAQTAGLDVLTPFEQQATEQRRISQQKSLDRIFELRRTLTEEEWGKVFAKLE
jgi:Sec-independent protein translocase protein TatA